MNRQLVTISAFITDYFAEGSRPSRNTVVSWIRDGIIQGEQIGGPGGNGKRGGPWYVFPHTFNRTEYNNPKLAELIIEFEEEAERYYKEKN